MPTDDINEDELNESNDDSESDSDDSESDSDDESIITSVATSDHWTNFRNELAQAMFNDWRARGFGWDAEKKLLQVDKAVYDEWVKQRHLLAVNGSISKIGSGTNVHVMSDSWNPSGKI
uniref:Myb/SANT-like domain-containing protein n=1 Tax=Chenopodium quinoa TaxID=63459 RepID=A0A803MN69_CHEQI